ncbi:MAG TPA: hypothetical protein VHS59_05370 [Bacillota bacterium]|nr:hypothetical protein [Bacillota bacterium]
MNIKITLNTPYMTKQDVRKLVKDVEIFCLCGLRLHGLDFDNSEVCPECGREFHLQDGTGHFHVIINKPTEPPGI